MFQSRHGQGRGQSASSWKQNRSGFRPERLESRSLLAGTPELVFDLAKFPADSDPRDFVQAGDKVFFTAYTANAGRELWVSDGTDAGTRQVADIELGNQGSGPLELTAVGGRVFFTASDGRGTYQPEAGKLGRELWVSDGTAAGTQLVADLRGAGKSSDPGSLTAFNGKLYFSATDDVDLRALYVTDGTSLATSTVPGSNAESLLLSPFLLSAISDRLFLFADDQASEGSGNALFSVDAAGKALELLPDETQDGLQEAATAGNQLYFTHADPLHGTELWASDGTVAGTRLVLDIRPGTANSLIEDITPVGNRVYFSADDGKNGTELWVSDGTAAGTQLVRNLSSGVTSSAFLELEATADRLYFSALVGNEIRPSLWVTDGTSAATRQVVAVDDPAAPADPRDLAFNAALNQLFFRAEDNNAGKVSRLWVSDGFSAGTRPVAFGTLNEPLQPTEIVALGGRTYFQGGNAAVGREPFFTDGTAAGTQLLHDAHPGTGSSDPTSLVSYKQHLYFSAQDSAGQFGLYRANGKAGSAETIRTFGDNNFEPLALVPFRDQLVFVADDGKAGSEVWISDGTTLGTRVLKDLAPGLKGSDPRELTVVQDTLYFLADSNEDFVSELWKSDGTESGTVMVTELFALNYAYELTASGGKLFFAASDDGLDTLWVSNGTAAGTAPLIPTGAVPNVAKYLTDVNGRLYFSATTSAAGRELWSSDGTAGGTSLVQDIRAGASSSDPQQLTAVNGVLVFTATDGSTGHELWRAFPANGTVSRGPDVLEGIAGSYPHNITHVNETVFFSATTPANGFELWQTDFTKAGTQRVTDLVPGAGSSAPTSLAGLDGSLYFSAINGLGSGNWEPWLLAPDKGNSGKFADPAQLGELASGALGSFPTQFTLVRDTQVGDVVFFSATTPGAGTELWQLVLNPVNTPPTANPGGPYVAPEGSTIRFDASASTDLETPGGVPDSAEWDFDYDGVNFTVDATGRTVDRIFGEPVPTRTIAVRVRDAAGLASVATTTLQVTDRLPTLTVSAPSVVVFGGQPGTLAGTFGSLQDTVTLSASVGTVTQRGDGTWSWDFTPGIRAASSVVTITAVDNDGNTTTVQFNLQIRKPADFDNNGKVDIEDFIILRRNFGKQGTQPLGDANFDGKIDISDFVILRNTFGV